MSRDTLIPHRLLCVCCLSCKYVLSVHSGVYLENQTVLLGRPAHFFCQFPGKYEDLRLSIDGGVIRLSFTGPNLNLTIENTTLESVTVHSINITIY